MEYAHEQYERDLKNPDMPHLKDNERFKAFYNELGRGEVQQDLEYPTRMDFVQIRQGAKVLELGCHSGYDMIKWLNMDKANLCIGVDISHTLIEAAQERLTKEVKHGTFQLIEGFIEDLPSVLPTTEHEFTDIVLTETLEHVQDPVSILVTALKYMTLNVTRLWITVPSTRWGNFSHVRGITSEQLKVYLQKAGFDGQDTKFLRLEVKNGMTHALIALRYKLNI